jgi:hypothetical protein
MEENLNDLSIPTNTETDTPETTPVETDTVDNGSDTEDVADNSTQGTTPIRPEYLLEKYKDEAEQAKALPHLEEFHKKTVSEKDKEINSLKSVLQKMGYEDPVKAERAYVDAEIDSKYKSLEKKLMNEYYPYIQDKDAAFKAFETNNLDAFINALHPGASADFGYRKARLDIAKQLEAERYEQDQQQQFHNSNLESFKQYEETNKEFLTQSPARKKIYEEVIKSSGIFNETGISESLKKFEDYHQMRLKEEKAQQELQNMNNDAKQRMGSAANTNSTVNDSNKTFTREEIKQMDLKTFEKYEKQIFSQMAKGQIK